MKKILDDVENKNLYQNNVFVVDKDITHVDEDAFVKCSELSEIIFTKPVGIIHKMNGCAYCTGLFKRNGKLKTIVFPEEQDQICFNMLLNCASPELEIHLSHKAHMNLSKDIMDYNKTAFNKFSIDLVFKVYDKTNKFVLPSSKSDADAGDGHELKK